MTALVQVDVLHVFVSEGDETIDFRPPIMSPVSTSQVEKCICPANTVGLSCQVSYFTTLCANYLH